VYYVETSAALSGGFSAIPDEPAFANNRCQLTVNPDGESRFFRLQRYVPSDD
jgi:hypothetical protein